MASVPALAIPVVDIAPLVGGGADGKIEAAKQISNACETTGFFYVINHGVAADVIGGAVDAARRFFSLPIGQRQAVAVNRINRGYMKMREVTVPGYEPDLKETFELGIDLPADDPDVVAGKPLHGPNQWPALDGFRAPVMRYFDTVIDLGRTLLGAVAIALDEPEDFFAPMFERPIGSMRLLHYPPQASYAPREHGVAPHTDYGAITLLYQDETGGLEVQTRDGAWIGAPFLAHSFVVNIGDMMACWTNDRFTSNPHRVFNRAGRDRFSIPVFLIPQFDTKVTCIRSCQSPTNPPKYPPIGSGEYILAKYHNTFAYRQRDRGE